jgi:formylglycine-generating enzyme required for sulfatase activity
MKFPKSAPLIAAVALLCTFLTSCNEDVTVSIKTFSPQNVTNTSATISGTIDMVGDEIKESGFLLSTKTTITLKYTNSQRMESTGTLSDVRVELTGLSADSSYRFRLYAKTDDSIYYGSSYSFYPRSVVLPTVAVPAGSFKMGGTGEQQGFAMDNEFPVHTVFVNGFNMGVTEVTNAQFLNFLRSRKVGVGGSGLTAGGVTKTLLYANMHGLQYSADSAAWFIEPGFENHPVVRVTWYGANEFCRWAGGRLPTEAEWEWAARGANSHSTNLFSGGVLADSTIVAWYKFNTKALPVGHKDTQPVGTKAKNELDLYDMSGNAWEWVADWYNLYLPMAQSNPVGMSDADAAESGVTHKVRRGGGWADEDVNALRVSRRDHNEPELNLGSCGFRFVKD